MKKLIIGIASAGALSLLAGCGASDTAPTTIAAEDTAISTNTAAEYETQATTTTQEVTTQTTTAGKKVEYHTFDNSYTNDDGYKLDTTLEISDWFGSDNYDLLYSEWSKISSSEFPSRDKFGIYDNKVTTSYLASSSNYFDFQTKDVYYAIGRLHYKNVTEGFKIDSENKTKFDPAFYIDGDLYQEPLTKLMINNDKLEVGYLSASNFVKSKSSYASPLYNISKDSGYLTIIFAMPIDITPNEPEGYPDPTTAEFAFHPYGAEERNVFSLDIIE